MNKHFSVSQLQQMRMFYRNNPTGILKIDWMTKWTAYEFNQWFMTCLHQKISIHIPLPQPMQHLPRKYDTQWQNKAKRVAINLSNRTIVRVNEVPIDLRNRLAHRLYNVDDL